MADDDDRRDAPPQNRGGTGPETSGNTDRGADGRFGKGNRANPGGRPATSKAFRELAQEFSTGALRKLMTIALKGNGQAAVRACEIIIERAWGRTPLEVSGPRGGPLDVRFHGAVRSALEAAIAEAQAEAVASAGPPDDDPKN